MRPYNTYIFFFLLAIIGCACNRQAKTANHATATPVIELVESDSPTEAHLRQLGLKEIVQADSTIGVHLVYATPYNFTGKILYTDIHKAFAQPELVKKIVKAQKMLKSIRPDLNLLVYDAARPESAQKRMWEIVRGTLNAQYVANPYKSNGMHNYGAAVDVTLMDCTGRPLPMGSEYDYFGEEAHTNNEAQLLETGRITQRELENRQLLRRVMCSSGFYAIPAEWWHFNCVRADEVATTFKIIQ